MASDLNQCNFIGRLGRDPEIRYMPNGNAVASFSIAVGWKGKETEGVEWVNITAFDKLAEICGEYLTKGKQVFIGGRFKTEKWADKDGNDRYSTKIIADRMQMLGSKSDNESSRNEYIKQSGGSDAAKPAPAATQSGFDDMEDDIPF